MPTTNSNTLELGNDTVTVGNVEGLGGPVRGDNRRGVVQERKSLITPVRHSNSNVEVVNIGHNLLASAGNGDVKGSENRRRTGE